MLALGLGSRLIGLMLSLNMFMAYVTACREALTSIFPGPGKFYNSDPFTFLMASLLLLLLIFAAGFLSGDRLIQRILDGRKSNVSSGATFQPATA